MTDLVPCPCGSGRNYDACCGPFHRGELPVTTAEALMRSRYSAYVRGKSDYLLATWHHSTRPVKLDLESEPAVVWLGLEILNVDNDGKNPKSARVEFIVGYQTAAGPQQLHERSRFLNESGNWYYIDGEFPETQPAPEIKPGRNTPCPCASGKKYKRCCGA